MKKAHTKHMIVKKTEEKLLDRGKEQPPNDYIEEERSDSTLTLEARRYWSPVESKTNKMALV